MGGADIQNMKFDTFGLPDELGRFLGDLDRNKLAFALTGESGSGKSYFSYELARLFLDGGFKVKYYSLEEGIGKLTQEKLVIYDIGNEMQLTGEGGLKDIRKDAELFDVIVVDSFSKLTSDPKEFENLRSRFPKTIFIIIFQQTTAKTMKGGASIKYNSSATINLKKVDGERVATMEKGRYGTQGWVYSIDQEKIITEF
jgi:archaellum biogenesis ATPase FlaH